MHRLAAFFLAAIAALLLFACGGDGDGIGNIGNEGTGDADETVSVGPPLPVAVDESGVPKTSDADRIAFTGGNVVTLTDAGVLESTTVVVENGRIVGIIPDTQFVPAAGTEIIDASGRWLMPGLVDAHIHLVTNGEDDLLLYLAAGVTAVRVMWGNEIYLQWRDEIEVGSRVGPRLRVASPGLDGSGAFWPGSVIVTNENEARTAVQEQVAKGFDFIKVYNSLQMESYLAIADEAESLGVPIVGHVPFAVGADLALSDGRIRSIEHFTRFQSEVTTGNDWNTPLDGSKAAGFVEKVRLAGVWNVPTLTVQLRPVSQVDALQAHPIMGWVSDGMRSFILDVSTQPRAGSPLDPASRYALLRMLRDADARIAVGTDTGLRYVFPGFSIHEELAHFVAAGLSPEEAIRAATVSAWELLGEADESGTVEVGKRADLLLLAADPFADIANLNKRVGVMANGYWYAQSHLMDIVQDQ